MKKFNSLFLLLLLSSSTYLFAETYSGGNVSESDPYQIANLNALQYLSEHSVIRNGKVVSNGVDHCKLNAGKDSEIKKMLLLK